MAWLQLHECRVHFDMDFVHLSRRHWCLRVLGVGMPGLDEFAIDVD